MKHFFRALIFLAIGIFLIACGQAVSQSSQTPDISPTPSAVSTTTPVPSSLPTFIVIPTQTNVPSTAPTLIPVIEPILVDGLLEKAFSVPKQTSMEGYQLRQITGWDYGFRHRCSSYQWMDSIHLILFPSTGQAFAENYGIYDFTRPVVINFETGSTWLPPYDQQRKRDCGSTPWSSELGLLILSDYIDQKDGVSTYTPDGNITKHYSGKLIGVSPSGTKILIEDDTWVDLISGKIVDFAWYQPTDEFIYFPQPIWSPDETQVFTCCYHFGDANSGKSHNFPYNQVTLNGKPYEDALYQSYGSWVQKNSLVLLQWDGFYGSNPGFTPLYDPQENTLRNLNQLAGISTESELCQYASASPNEKYVWIQCSTADYLVNLSNFETKSYLGYSQVDIHWSTDSSFAWFESYDLNNNRFEILSISNKELASLPVSPLSESPLQWHPTKNILVFLSKDGQKLEILNPQNMSLQELEFQTTFSALDWSPSGDHIVLTAEDGSLWLVNYANLGGLKQLTEPMSNIRDVFWSPDGNSIAFVSGADIYIVDTTK